MASSTCEPQKETKEHIVLCICSCLWHGKSWGNVGHEEGWYSQVGRTLCSIDNANAWAHRAFPSVWINHFPINSCHVSSLCPFACAFPLHTTHALRVNRRGKTPWSDNVRKAWRCRWCDESEKEGSWPSRGFTVRLTLIKSVFF